MPKPVHTVPEPIKKLIIDAVVAVRTENPEALRTAISSMMAYPNSMGDASPALYSAAYTGHVMNLMIDLMTWDMDAWDDDPTLLDRCATRAVNTLNTLLPGNQIREQVIVQALNPPDDENETLYLRGKTWTSHDADTETVTEGLAVLIVALDALWGVDEEMEDFDIVEDVADCRTYLGDVLETVDEDLFGLLPAI